MNSKVAIINAVMADLSYAIENQERLGGYMHIQREQIECAIEVLRQTRTQLMAILTERLEP